MSSDPEAEGRALAVDVWRQLDEDTRDRMRDFCMRNSELFGAEPDDMVEAFEQIALLASVS